MLSNIFSRKIQVSQGIPSLLRKKTSSQNADVIDERENFNFFSELVQIYGNCVFKVRYYVLLV